MGVRYSSGGCGEKPRWGSLSSLLRTPKPSLLYLNSLFQNPPPKFHRRR